MSVDGAEGDMAVFNCEAGGIPEPANFWYINGELTSSMLCRFTQNIKYIRLFLNLHYYAFLTFSHFLLLYTDISMELSLWAIVLSICGQS